jgi:ketosteroid isomerase-like protein
MKNTIALIGFVLAVSSISFGQAKPAAGQGAIQEVIALEKAWGTAAQKYDVSWFEKNIAENYSGVMWGTEIINKAAKIANVKNKAQKAEASDESMKVQPFGDAAIATGITLVKGTYKGQDVSGRYAWTDTWVKIDGRWQMVAGNVLQNMDQNCLPNRNWPSNCKQVHRTHKS